MLSTHCCLQALKAYLILQRDWESMQRTYRLALLLEESITLCSTCKCLLDEYLGQAVELCKSNRYQALDNDEVLRKGRTSC